jgi:hypothetical protein
MQRGRAGGMLPNMRSHSSPRRIGLPGPARVRADAGGVPTEVAGRHVSEVRDEWRIDEGWWTRRPVRRRYFELVLADGRNAVVFFCLLRGRWFSQRD